MDKQQEAFIKAFGVPDNYRFDRGHHAATNADEERQFLIIESAWKGWEAAQEAIWHPISEVPLYKPVWAYCKEANVKGVASETGGCMVVTYIPPSQHILGLFIDPLGSQLNWDFTHWCYLPQFGGES